MLSTLKLDRFISFNEATGLLRCESGILLGDILAFSIPKSWILPVLPGTQYVTLGGAVANDVHGKNHQRVGSFGAHVMRLELLRSDGQRIECSRSSHSELFRASIGGLGLTGLITWVEVRLKRISSGWLEMQTLRFRGFRAFLALSDQSSTSHEYSVAWLDCTSSGPAAARGLFFRANHSAASARSSMGSRRHFRIPFMPPINLVSGPVVRAFNTVYHGIQGESGAIFQKHYQRFFFPLDAIECWNRIYGRAGFVQHQCVLPMAGAESALEEILRLVSQSGHSPFLTVLKCFGDLPREGLLSFPRHGVTLAMDFPWRKDATRRLFEAIDDIVARSGGAVYPAKDALMSSRHFLQFFPQWESMLKHIDPRFSSSFWRRVVGDS